MKQIIMILLSTSLLFSASIVGSWKIEKARTIKANKKENKMAMKMFERMDIYKNHTVQIKPSGLDSKWVKSGKGYYMILHGDKVPITSIDVNHLTLQFDKDMVHYKRTSSKAIKQAFLKQSQVKFKLDRIYRSKIKDDYAFILLSKNRTMYFLQTDRKKTISVKEIKAGKLKVQKKRNGFTFSDKAVYELKNGNPYIVLESKEIKVLSSKKFKYRGNVYELQK